MPIQQELLEKGWETIKEVESSFPEATNIEVASGISRAIFGAGFFDNTVYVNRTPAATAIHQHLLDCGVQNPQAGAVETPYEWAYGVMAVAGLKPRRRVVAYILESAFRVDTGIDGRGINKSFGKATSSFWFSLGGELLQSHIRGYARVRELRLATLGLMSALRISQGSLSKLSTLYRTTADAYHLTPTEKESDIFIRSNDLITPKFGHTMLRSIANVLPGLERVGIIPISRQTLADESDKIDWPQTIHTHQDYEKIAQIP